MHMKKIWLLSLCLFWVISLAAQLTLKVTDIPENTPTDASIYAAGTFNGWDSGDPDYILTDNLDGTFEITINVSPGEVKFKFTRGSWETVEGNANGGYQPDHVFEYTGGAQTAEIEILSWEDLGGTGSDNSTAADNVHIVDESFFMPQLNRERRVWIYLPPDYEDSGKYYPVLYMHDGQNVFDAFTSFSGEWEVDESLNQLFGNGDEGIIVVAIDNGGANRFNEYSPWVHPTYGGGQGDEYMQFIVETLKPYIDDNYRTRTEREHTGLMGSSMGGLISLYGAIEYQEVFSKAGIFSPAFWVAPEAYNHVSSTGKEADMRVYFLAGEQESASMVPDMQAMYNTMLDAGFSESELFFLTHSDGQHSEWYWAREFPDAYIWLYANSMPTDNEAITIDPSIRFAPNPTDSMLNLISEKQIKSPRLEVYTLDGKLVQKRRKIRSNQLNVSDFPEGFYLFNLYSRKTLVSSQKIVIQR
jgi:predicted alpha/beta superfamily hydrolase